MTKEKDTFRLNALRKKKIQMSLSVEYFLFVMEVKVLPSKEKDLAPAWLSASFPSVDF